MFDGRIVFVLTKEGGELRPQGKGRTPQTCGFASGESRDALREELIMRHAAKAKDWDSFEFKLKLDGFSLQFGKDFRAPFGKL